MAKFLIGVIIGVAVGIFAMSANPNLVEEVRADLATLTALVMRQTEQAAEDLGNTAEDLADQPPANGAGDEQGTGQPQ